MKKLLLFLVCMTMTFTSTSIIASEIEQDNITYAWQQEAYNEAEYAKTTRGVVISGDNGEVAIDTDMDQPLSEERQTYLKALESKKRLRYNGYATCAVPVYEQLNNYYCGPATLKQVTHYINGWSDSQDDLADELGTTSDGSSMIELHDVLNDYVGGRYIYSDIGDIDDWIGYVQYSIDVDRPSVLDINTTYVSAFPYSSNGHFVNVSGYDISSSSGEVRITDPYGPGIGNRWYDQEDLYQANNDHFRQAIIW